MRIICPNCNNKNIFLSHDFCGEYVMCKKCYQPILWEVEVDSRHKGVGKGAKLPSDIHTSVEKID